MLRAVPVPFIDPTTDIPAAAVHLRTPHQNNCVWVANAALRPLRGREANDWEQTIRCLQSSSEVGRLVPAADHGPRIPQPLRRQVRFRVLLQDPFWFGGLTGGCCPGLFV